MHVSLIRMAPWDYFNPAPTWTYPTFGPVEDVAINDAGTYMAAVDYRPPHTLYFFDRQGKLLWHDVHISGRMLYISCDGETLAVGHYPHHYGVPARYRVLVAMLRS